MATGKNGKKLRTWNDDSHERTWVVVTGKNRAKLKQLAFLQEGDPSDALAWLLDVFLDEALAGEMRDWSAKHGFVPAPETISGGVMEIEYPANKAIPVASVGENLTNSGNNF